MKAFWESWLTPAALAPLRDNFIECMERYAELLEEQNALLARHIQEIQALTRLVQKMERRGK